MNNKKILEALSSPMRRSIIKVLSQAKNGLTVKEVMEILKTKESHTRYRETVYRALENLHDAELVEKYYVDGKGICYKLKLSKVEIDLSKLDER